jgi:hypothetical protein
MKAYKLMLKEEETAVRDFNNLRACYFKLSNKKQ